MMTPEQKLIRGKKLYKHRYSNFFMFLILALVDSGWLYLNYIFREVIPPAKYLEIIVLIICLPIFIGISFTSLKIIIQGKSYIDNLN